MAAVVEVISAANAGKAMADEARVKDVPKDVDEIRQGEQSVAERVRETIVALSGLKKTAEDKLLARGGVVPRVHEAGMRAYNQVRQTAEGSGHRQLLGAAASYAAMAETADVPVRDWASRLVELYDETQVKLTAIYSSLSYGDIHAASGVVSEYADNMQADKDRGDAQVDEAVAVLHAGMPQ